MCRRLTLTRNFSVSPLEKTCAQNKVVSRKKPPPRGVAVVALLWWRVWSENGDSLTYHYTPPRFRGGASPHNDLGAVLKISADFFYPFLEKLCSGIWIMGHR